MSALAVVAGQGAAHWLLTTAAVLTGQLSAGWSNDALDALRDNVAGRRGKPVVAGTVRTAEVWAAAFAALALCVPLSLACGPWAGAVHLAGVAAAWGYNLRLKATAWSWARERSHPRWRRTGRRNPPFLDPAQIPTGQ
ncbi:hypothetical protein FCI23_35190 [Actinacidiphila oryziradicis]|uniref:Uncharacterized protein n=1 Tax=Actinacidiphila oryziradicis TaxID=2571141 RepID=A0A4U0S6S7_9ACTN|nr:hypothetical protein FCI23_35190 [Actinacidiphila oryziradicis]